MSAVEESARSVSAPTGLRREYHARNDNAATAAAASLNTAARAVASSMPHRPTSPVLFSGMVRVAEFAAILVAGGISAAVCASDAGANGAVAAYLVLVLAGAFAAVL